METASLPGTVVAVTGLISYRVKLDSGEVRKCHQDQLRSLETVSENSGSPKRESMDLSIPLPSFDDSYDDDQSSNENDTESYSNTETRRVYPSRIGSQPNRYEPRHSNLCMYDFCNVIVFGYCDC